MSIIAGLSATPFSDVVAIYDTNVKSWVLANATKEDLTAPFHRSVIGLKVFGPRDPITITGAQFGDLLSGLEWAFFELCRYLYENRDTVAARSNFKTAGALISRLNKQEVAYFQKYRVPGISLGPLGSDTYLRPDELVVREAAATLKKSAKNPDKPHAARVIMAQSRRVFGCALPPAFPDSHIECTGHLMVSTVANVLDSLALLSNDASKFTYALTRYAMPV